MYNPWSVLKCIEYKGSLEKYRVNTSDNILIKRLIGQVSQSFKIELQALLEGTPIKQAIEEALTFKDSELRTESLWTLLLFTGYVTYAAYEVQGGSKVALLRIPNKEIKNLYIDLIKQIFQESLIASQPTDILNALIQGETSTFHKLPQTFILETMSHFDLPSTESVRSYHLFILGLLTLLKPQYEVKSNHERGFGRYDVMLIPANPDKPAIIIEFKKVLKKEMLEIAAQKSLDQIFEKHYAQDLKSHNFKQIRAYGIAVSGKNILIKSTDSFKTLA